MIPDLLTFWLVSENTVTGFNRQVWDPAVLSQADCTEKNTGINLSYSQWTFLDASLANAYKLTAKHGYNRKYVFNICVC